MIRCRNASVTALSLVGVMLACRVPPAPPSPREATSVAASVGRSWDAAIDMFAERNIAIRTIERASGILVAEPVSVPVTHDAKQRRAYADCGASMGVPVPPTSAFYNVLVRGDSTASMVKVTVRYVEANGIECSTTGAWETEAEAWIRDRAQTERTR